MAALMTFAATAGIVVACGNSVGSGIDNIPEYDMVDKHSIPVAGHRYSFVIKPDSSLWAWGDNTYGQLGTGTRGHRYPYTEPVHIMDGVASVYAGSNMRTYALTINGNLYSWGSNTFSPNSNDDGRLNRVRIMENISHFSNGLSSSGIAVTTNGELYRIRRQNQPYMPVAFKINFIMDDVTYANDRFAITTDGRLYYFAANATTGLGAQILNGDAVPKFVMDEVDRVTSGGGNHLILRTDGTLWIALGVGCISNSVSTIKLMDEVAYVTTGRASGVAAIRTDGTLWACGY